jgi:ribosomal protein S18 acetylase RimI-like enzyme
MLQQRPAETLDDLRLAGQLMARAWRAGAPVVAATPAAIEWWHAATAPEPLSAHLRLWSELDEDVAWTWHDGDEVEWHVWTGDTARDAAVFRAILHRLIDDTPTRPIGIFTAEDDRGTIAALTDRGFAPAGRRLSQFLWRPAEGRGVPGAPSLPPGYRIRPLAGRGEVPARVDVHRAAFASSRLTIEKYERLLTLPHYRFEDDLVVGAPDGDLAAFAMAWWDPDARVGEFEPVGTHPAHQRRGIARALLSWGLHRYARRGAGIVQVYSEATNAASEALYGAVGFRRRAYHGRYERPGGPDCTTGPGPDLQSGP